MPETTERMTAGFFPRLFAYILDRLILGFLLLWVRVPMWTSILGGSELFSKAVLFHYSAQEVICALLGAAYFVTFTALKGTTPGKKAMGLRVISADGSDVGWKTAFFRETVGRYLSSLLCIGYFFILGDTRHRALHDRIYDTLVVVGEKKKEAAPAVENGWYRVN